MGDGTAGVLFVSGSLGVNAVPNGHARSPAVPVGTGRLSGLSAPAPPWSRHAGQIARLLFSIRVWRRWSARRIPLAGLVMATATLGVVSALLNAPPALPDLHLAGAAARSATTKSADPREQVKGDLGPS
jgi:hypothetical protein